jgi:WD40 repeat protein
MLVLKFRQRFLQGFAALMLGLFITSAYSYLRYRFIANPIYLINSLPSSLFLEKALPVNSTVDSIDFSADGQTITISSGKNIQLYNLKTGEEIDILSGNSWGVNSVVISPNGKILASGGSDDTIKLWDLTTRKEILTLRGHDLGINSVVFTPDSKKLISGGWDNTIKIWNIATGKEIHTIKDDELKITSIALSPDGKTIASASWEIDKTIQLWDVETGRKVRTLIGHSSTLRAIAFSSDSKTLASAANDNTIKLWNLATGQEIRTLQGLSANSLSFHPNGQILASATNTTQSISHGGVWDNDIKLWNVTTGEQIRSLKGHIFGVFSLAFSPDGKTLVSSGGDETVKIWRVSP